MAGLARLCGCHRVSAERTVDALHRRGVLRRVGSGHAIAWDVLAMLPRVQAASTRQTSKGRASPWAGG
jgi:hypothetical protein